ncbi:MAG: hypothetical protein OXQ29_20805 [Rhodospirillaceae bacterium]|nr:hypothetical protein [Rhodospirillaceae bacterium]
MLSIVFTPSSQQIDIKSAIRPGHKRPRLAAMGGLSMTFAKWQPLFDLLPNFNSQPEPAL